MTVGIIYIARNDMRDSVIITKLEKACARSKNTNERIE